MIRALSEQTHGSVRLVIVICLVTTVGLIAAILWAAAATSVFAGISYLSADRWGIVTLMDVYAGAIVVAIWMWIGERQIIARLLWVLALLCLGHLVSLIYVLVRAGRSRTLADLIKPATELR